MTELCYTPVAYSAAYGIAICILEKGHEGSCDGGALERRICDDFVAQMIQKHEEHFGSFKKFASWSNLTNEQLSLDI